MSYKIACASVGVGVHMYACVELLLCSVLNVGFFLHWNITYKCVCVCARTGVCMCMCVCCFVGTDGCIPLTVLVDVCQCCCLLVFVCLLPFETLSLL